jgi:hypothetical protein
VSGPIQAVTSSGVSHRFVSVENTLQAAELWTSVVLASPNAWFWHTWANLQFNLVAGRKYESANLSFFVIEEDQVVGVVPLIVNRIQIGKTPAWDASYYGGPLPCPIFLPKTQKLETLEQLALLELEKRARDAGAVRIRLRHEPPMPTSDEDSWLEKIVNEQRYIDSSYASHWMHIHEGTLARVRERYRRYVKKFSPGDTISIADGKAVSEELEQMYFQLHVKDAGGQFRSRDSYTRQADLARVGEAFFVLARRGGNNDVAGMLLVSLFKNSAYDNSVAVEPAFQNEYVSHLMKWFAIEELTRRNALAYELGPKAGLPSFMSLPSEKNRGISHFKEGWVRDAVRRVKVGEKFLNADCLQTFMKEQADSLQAYFGLH